MMSTSVPVSNNGLPSIDNGAIGAETTPNIGPHMTVTADSNRPPTKILSTNTVSSATMYLDDVNLSWVSAG